MDRIEHVVLHGDFRVVATAEKVQPRGPDEPRCKVLVSLWQLGKDAVSSTPEMIRLEDPRATSLGEAADQRAHAVTRGPSFRDANALSRSARVVTA